MSQALEVLTDAAARVRHHSHSTQHVKKKTDLVLHVLQKFFRNRKFIDLSKGLLVFFFAIIIILVENGLKTKILSFIAIISGTIYHPAKCVILTGLILLSNAVFRPPMTRFVLPRNKQRKETRN